MIGLILEWAAFGSSLLCVFCYGHSKFQGSIVGLITALLFITYGIVAGIYAAAVTNVVFFLLHSRNLKRAIRDG